MLRGNASGAAIFEGNQIDYFFLHIFIKIKIITLFSSPQRQDLFSVLANYCADVSDQIHIKFALAKEDMDSYIFCVAPKRNAVKFSKELVDLVITGQ